MNRNKRIRLDNSLVVRTGEDFEGRLIDAFRAYAYKSGTEKYFLCTAHTELDTDYGTDVIVDGIPVDITCAFSRKNHTIRYNNAIEVDGEKVYFGIRRGNGHINFPNPVVVVGIDADMHFLNSFMDNVCKSITKVIAKIMDIVNEMFYDYCDRHNIEPVDYTKGVTACA